MPLAAIAKAGTHVVIPYRDEDEKRHLRVTGDLGQITSLVRLYPSFVDVRRGARWEGTNGCSRAAALL